MSTIEIHTLGADPIDQFGSVIVPALSSDLVYNVADYAATGDGSTNDTAAIQNAINAANTAGGGVVFFPRGTYRFTTLTLLSKVTLVGEAKEVSILKTLGPSAPSSLLSGTGTNITIADLTIDGNNHANSERGINITGNGNDKFLTVTRCRIQNFATLTGWIAPTNACGIYVWTSHQVRILDNEIVDCSDGIYMDDAEPTCRVEGNVITNPGTHCRAGITLTGGSGASVIDNKVFDVTVDIGAIGQDGHAIQNNGCQAARIIGNYVKNCKTAGVHVGDGGGGTIVQGNTLVDCCTLNGGAIYLESLFGHTDLPNTTDVFGATVVGNRIYNAGVFGIAVSYSAGSVIKGNHIAKCQQEGIICDSDRTLIEGNICINTHRSSTHLITASPDVLSQIRVYAGTRCSLIGNMAYDSAATKFVDYGIAVNDSNHAIVGNQLQGNKTAGLFEVASTTNQKSVNFV